LSETETSGGKSWGIWIGGAVAFALALYFMLAPLWVEALRGLVSRGVVARYYGNQISAPIHRLLSHSDMYRRMYWVERDLAERAGLIRRYVDFGY
jgi:hypothetical protein